MNDCPPVLLLAWHRHDLARRVFDRIREAKPRKLYLGVDGIRDEIQRPGWEATRGLAQEVDWECEVKCRFLEKNEGCRSAVSGAISWFFEHEEEGIILEDDCLPDLSFFNYCRQALDRYRSEGRVMQVCGTNLFGGMMAARECRFSTSGSPWGWATWRRAWQSHDTRMDVPIINWGDPSLRDWLGSAAALRLWEHRQKACVKGWVNSWDFPWQLHAIQQRGLFLVPAVNMVQNLGCGGASTHTTEADSLVDSTPAGPHPMPVVFPAELKPDPTLDLLHLQAGMREFTRPETTLAEATRDLMDCHQPAKDVRKVARDLAKWVSGQGCQDSSMTGASGLAGLWRKLAGAKPSAASVPGNSPCQKMVDSLNDAAARLEGLVATREIHCKSATGGKYLHANLSFAQEGEDRVLARIFGDQPNGFYVDVGAHHPFRFSNTWLFYQRGWRGINLDPAPDVMQAFHLWRPRDTNLNLGVAAQPGELSFFAFKEIAYSTFSEKVAMERAAVGLGGEMTKHTVPVLPLCDILGSHLPPGTRIDFMSIDTEGFELQVLEGIDWECHRPKILLCESLGEKELTLAAANPLVVYLSARGYRFFAATFNTFFFEDIRTATDIP